jgi:hypothetical protein
MDKKRLQAYVTLIHQLLSCPSGEELGLLQANANLIDADFIRVVERVASQADNEGAVAAAEYLQNLAVELTSTLAEAQKMVNSQNGKNGDRSSAYLQLIEQLISCPSGAEADILRSNQDLIDAGFLQTLNQVAALLADMGEQKAAAFLQTIADQVGGSLENSSSGYQPKEYLDLLGDVLRATSKTNGDSRAVYPILEANLDKLDMAFARVMETWAKVTLPQLLPEVAENIAIDIVNFSTLLQQFLLGNWADNIEIAIAGYEIGLTYVTRDRSPIEWAMIQYNLGNAYSQCVRGDKVQNLELANEYYRDAIEVYFEMRQR